MAQPVSANIRAAEGFNTCELCSRRSGKGWSFAFKKPVTEGDANAGEIIKCSRCAIRHRPMVRRSLLVALTVGTVLTLLNQGDILFAGEWKSAMYWKIPLTYCVPFLVATYGALTNSRR
ncbi:MAG: nitrate/nitrite transporter NrtS [Chloroflexi bacterium]|nr:nitrate/nitrite transporter NrtS [Chloroflexota bacterium]MDA1272248.1 nitrate/nitrite transporter NrtS [Chloroflexota bacterium]